VEERDTKKKQEKKGRKKTHRAEQMATKDARGE
jgi:hypothetical protein